MKTKYEKVKKMLTTLSGVVIRLRGAIVNSSIKR
jgi:hypothetical protein